MSRVATPFSLRIAAFVALLAGLILTGEGLMQAQSKAEKKAVKKAIESAQKAEKKAKQVVNQELRLLEGERIKLAYFYVAMANHNYEGHRVKAMKQLEEALDAVEAGIKQKGTKAQKAAARQQELGQARAKFLAKHSAKVNEPQVLSDLQMREALRLLLELRPALIANNHPVILENVNSAIRQIELALKSR